MIKDISKYPGRMDIDLTGSGGNAFVLIGTARRLAKKLGKDPDDIARKMESGDYENLISVFEAEFGDFVTLYR